MQADPTVPQVVRSYLAQLERALGEASADVRAEILAGIREELDGLDAAAAAARIESLGDPEFIGAEARAEGAAPAPRVTTPSVEAVGREPGWFPVLAALAFAIGGLIIPLYGWFVGLGLVWFSRSWTTMDKLIATLIGPAAVVIAALIAFAGELSAGSIGPGGISAISAIYNSIVDQLRLLMLVNGVVGIWLAWRVSRRWWRPKAGKDDHDG